MRTASGPPAASARRPSSIQRAAGRASRWPSSIRYRMYTPPYGNDAPSRPARASRGSRASARTSTEPPPAVPAEPGDRDRRRRGRALRPAADRPRGASPHASSPPTSTAWPAGRPPACSWEGVAFETFYRRGHRAGAEAGRRRSPISSSAVSTATSPSVSIEDALADGRADRRSPRRPPARQRPRRTGPAGQPEPVRLHQHQAPLPHRAPHRRADPRQARHRLVARPATRCGRR